MDSVIISRVLSSRPMSSARPLSTARPITSTGLMAPKTGRGRSAAAIRRMVQDKTYWLGVLRAKMNELTMEIAVLSKECDLMSAEEARLNMWQRKAETLARELKLATLELSVYNDYWDRLRIGENSADILEDINAIKNENSELSELLEAKYKEKKAKEDEIYSGEREIQKIEAEWNSLKRQFASEQRERFEELESLNRSLTMESDRLENKIMKLAEKKRTLEESNSNENSSLRKEVLNGLNRLRELERQKNDLTSDQNTDGERSRLLAQVRRDNKEISDLENRLEEIRRSIEEQKSSLIAYEDGETAEKFRDLKKKESTIDSFLTDFSANLNNEMEKMTSLGESIADLVDKSSRYIRFIETLKGNDGTSGRSGGGDTEMTLIDERRKLQLDLNKIDQLESKINSELESLRTKIDSLIKDIDIYGNLDGLRDEIDKKESSLIVDKKSLEENIRQLKSDKIDLEKLVENVKINLEENEVYKKIKDCERKLSDLVAVNEEYHDKLRANDNSRLMKQVFEITNRYNQYLLGF
ncbi:intraflagellar transport protein 74 homolog [Panonychus citri]|uniref:intraflagellar transport protein 74 homolog n=1 Tax=Panonychus citri TaxID=50023 RepID=UPI002308351C|nr:intraflagellar transport protein 74 homolog [Panonychus citri]